MFTFVSDVFMDIDMHLQAASMHQEHIKFMSIVISSSHTYFVMAVSYAETCAGIVHMCGHMCGWHVMY